MLTEEIRAKARKARWEHTETWPDGQRMCRKCGELKEYTEFHRHRFCKGGYNSVCKKCRKPVSKKQWYDHTLEYKIWHRAKSRAKKNGVVFDLTLDDIIIPEYCPVLGLKLVVGDPVSTPSLDRTDPKRGYVRGNIQVMSNRANMLKNDASVDELTAILKYIQTLGL